MAGLDEESSESQPLFVIRDGGEFSKEYKTDLRLEILLRPKLPA
jgi:hypothetical protein